MNSSDENLAKVREAFALLEHALEEQAAIIVDMAEWVLDMRDQFETDLEFAHWLVENETTGNGPTFFDLAPRRAVVANKPANIKPKRDRAAYMREFMRRKRAQNGHADRREPE